MNDTIDTIESLFVEEYQMTKAKNKRFKELIRNYAILLMRLCPEKRDDGTIWFKRNIIHKDEPEYWTAYGMASNNEKPLRRIPELEEELDE